MLNMHDVTKLFPMSGILYEVVNSPLDLYLTGSRFFGHARIDSDFDFFTNYNDLAVRTLGKLGFAVIGPYETGTMARVDPGIITVMRNKIATPNIDVQLVRSVKERVQVRDLLFAYGRLSAWEKKERVEIWTLAHELIRLEAMKR